MSQARGSFWPTHSVSLLLSGGRAPLCWQRELARAAARLDALRRSCAWVKALAEVRPELRDGPLFGNCLTALAAEAAHLAQREPEVARPPQAIANRPVESPARERQFASDADRPTRWPGVSPPTGWRTVPPRSPHLPDERRARQAIADLAGLPQQASHRLLHRLIGAEEPSRGVDPSNPSPTISLSRVKSHSSRDASQVKPRLDAPSPQPEHFGRPRSAHGNEGRQQAKVGPLSGGHEPAAHRAWRDDLIKRAGHALRRAGASRLSPSGRSLSPATRTEQGKPVLAQQWSARIAGPVASGERLMQMVGRGSERHDVAARAAPENAHREMLAMRGHPRGAARQTLSRSRHRELLLALEGDDDQHVPDCAPEAGGLADRILPPIIDASGAMTLPVASRTRGEGDPLSLTRIAPRAVKVMLPPFVSPKVVGMPAPSVAAASVLKGAQVEVDATEDDLSVLAAKIKRILDEEARRHGIDV